MAGHERDFCAGEFFGDRACLFGIAGVITHLQGNLLAQNAAGGVPGGDNSAFSVPATGTRVLFQYDEVTHVLTIAPITDVDAAGLAEPTVQHPVEDEVLYFLIPDRFADGNPGNNAPVAGVEQPGQYQGGDFVGVTQKINEGYFDKLGINTLWVTSPIDNAYNANPGSVAAALAEMSYRGGGRRIAVLGDMLELGEQSTTLHADVGRRAARARIDVLWAIGPLSEATARAARDAGLRNVHWSPSVVEAVEKPPVKVKSRDVVLFKASRAMALERVYDAVKGGIERRRRHSVERDGR